MNTGSEVTTFTVTNDNGEFGGKLDMSISIDRDSTLSEVFQVFERMALALTYQPGSLINAYRDRLAELTELAELRDKHEVGAPRDLSSGEVDAWISGWKAAVACGKGGN